MRKARSSRASCARTRIADYAALTAGMDETYATQNGQQMGDPVKAAQVIIDMVESDAAPVHLMLGEDAAIPGALKNTAQAL
ncbi:MAG: hypothetical protein J0H18_18410 [Rhizobiales bacterium]|nr:hypothetical protein [Hyphomicrobiales bacterium]